MLSRILHRPARRDSAASGLQRWLDSEPASPALSPAEEPSSSLDSFFLVTPPSSPVVLPAKLQLSPRPSPRSYNSTPAPKRKLKPKAYIATGTRADDPIQQLFGPLVPAKSFQSQARTVSMPSLARSASVKGHTERSKVNNEKVEMRFEARSGKKRRATMEGGAKEMLCGIKRISSTRPPSRAS